MLEAESTTEHEKVYLTGYHHKSLLNKSLYNLL